MTDPWLQNIVHHAAHSLRRLAHVTSGGALDVEDLEAVGLAAALDAGIEHTPQEATPRSWVYTLVKRRMIDEVRRMSMFTRGEERALLANSDASAELRTRAKRTALPDIHQDDVTPETQVARKQAFAALWGRLSERQQYVLVRTLHAAQGQQIADELGVSPTQISHTRAQIQRKAERMQAAT